MKTVLLIIFLTTLTFANNSSQGKIDMHGGKKHSLINGKNFSGAIKIIDTYLGSSKKKNTSNKKIIKIDEIKIDKIETTQN